MKDETGALDTFEKYSVTQIYKACKRSVNRLKDVSKTLFCILNQFVPDKYLQNWVQANNENPISYDHKKPSKRGNYSISIC